MELESLELEQAYAIKEQLNTFYQIRELEKKLREQEEYIMSINSNIQLLKGSKENV
jgi:hypothetical protein